MSLSLQTDDRFRRTKVEERKNSGAMLENVARCHRQNWIAPSKKRRSVGTNVVEDDSMNRRFE